MAHKKLNRPETGICREPPAFYEGCSSLLGLMPVIIETMLAAKEEDWGEIFYPVVK